MTRHAPCRCLLSASLWLWLTSPLVAQDPDFVLDLTNGEGVIEGTATVAVTLSSEAARVQGAEFAVCDGPTVETGFAGIALGAALDEDLLEFVDLAFDTDAWSASFQLVAGAALATGVVHELFVATYDLAEVGESEVDFCSSVLPPLVTTERREEFEPTTSAATIVTLSPRLFLRGDANDDGRVEPLLEAAYLHAWGFADGDEPPCSDAADADDDGVLSVAADGGRLLGWAFLGPQVGSPPMHGDPPPAPGPTTCGSEVGNGDLGCEMPPEPCPAEDVTLEPDPLVALSFGAALDIVEVGENVEFSVFLAIDSEPIQGFQFSVCDGPGLDLADLGPFEMPIARGPDLPPFPGLILDSLEIADGGWFVGALYFVESSPNEFAPDSYEMYTATYEVVAEGFSAVEFCALGDPAIPPRALRNLELVLPETESTGVTGVVTPIPGLRVADAEGLARTTAAIPVYLTK